VCVSTFVLTIYGVSQQREAVQYTHSTSTYSSDTAFHSRQIAATYRTSTRQLSITRLPIRHLEAQEHETSYSNVTRETLCDIKSRTGLICTVLFITCTFYGALRASLGSIPSMLPCTTCMHACIIRNTGVRVLPCCRYCTVPINDRLSDTDTDTDTP
jgi:hypothetical protein